ncbi:peptidase associated/transthyretin-like domain-containing protein [Cesiribacter andamanensis]|uniref:TonB-linked outer membrane protein, SusC/RagA family n=1 Tax=Cesiribacter andamanensis AMV16 TaxID=1279009 RepID=M7P1A8_9BACT|nr:hypothetical protein [Cesiribacter andamanensis]EMR04389.1 hypothetical protein ADICEAN_00423 [Cesiribacter andamanensis AMV16]
MDTFIRKTAFFVYILALLVAAPALAQQQQGAALYINGAIMDADSLKPLGGATVKNTNSGLDLQADEEGLFQMRAQPGDTLLIQHMTHQPAFYVLPQNLQGSSFAFVQVLQREHVMEPVTIFSFPSQQQFEQALLQLDPADGLTERTTNLDLQLQRLTNDPTRMQEYIDDYMRYQQLYVLPERGAPNNFLHPERWRSFIRDWREGRFDPAALNRLQGFPADDEIREVPRQDRPRQDRPEADDQ